MAKRIYPVIITLILLTAEITAQDGTLKFYYPDGKLESEISYVKEVLNGFSTWYYENGNKKKEVFYSDGKVNGWVKYYYENGLLKAEFSVTEGIRDGLTKFYYSNGALKEVRSYEKGKLIKKITLDKDETYIPPLEAYEGAASQIENRKNGNNFLCEVEFCPEPIGGMQSIMNKLVYPQHAKLYGLEGKVILKVFVDEHGNPQEIEVAQGLGLGCSEAAINAVRAVKFLPGEENGKVVQTWVAITIDFKLNDEKSKLLSTYKPVIEKPEFIYEKELWETDIEKVSDGKEIFLSEDSSEYFALNETENETETAEETEKLIEQADKENNVSVRKKEEEPEETFISDTIQLLGCDVQKCPEPKGGIEAIEKNLVVPGKVKRLKLQGTVIVEADIDQYGYVRDTRVLQKMGQGCDEAAEVAILDTHFFPAEENGKPIRIKLKIAVPFNYKNVK